MSKESKASKLRKRIAGVFHKSTEKVKFTDYAVRYIRERDLSEVYAATLLDRTKRLEEFVGEPLYVDALTEDLVNKYLVHVKESRKPKVKPITILSYRRNILAIWNGAADDKLCGYPMMRRVRKPRSSTPIPVGWTKEQVEHLIAFCEGIPGKTPSGIPSGKYWSACVRVGYDSALRSSDVRKLRREDIGETGIVSITLSKTRVRHLCQLRQSTLDAIAATFPPEREFIFEFGACRRSWFRAFKCLIEFAGLPPGSYKYLRRTSGSLVEAIEPGSGSKHLGHKSPRIFAEHYEDTRLSRPHATMPPELDIKEGGAA